jgi:epoxyqueuosine reductase
LRNAAIVLGNRPTPQAIPALIRGLDDSEPLVRGACAWALGRFGQAVADEALRRRREIEQDNDVLREIDSAFAKSSKCIAVDRVTQLT